MPVSRVVRRRQTLQHADHVILDVWQALVDGDAGCRVHRRHVCDTLADPGLGDSPLQVVGDIYHLCVGLSLHCHPLEDRLHDRAREAKQVGGVVVKDPLFQPLVEPERPYRPYHALYFDTGVVRPENQLVVQRPVDDVDPNALADTRRSESTGVPA